MQLRVRNLQLNNAPILGSPQGRATQNELAKRHSEVASIRAGHQYCILYFFHHLAGVTRHGTAVPFRVPPAAASRATDATGVRRAFRRPPHSTANPTATSTINCLPPQLNAAGKTCPLERSHQAGGRARQFKEIAQHLAFTIDPSLFCPSIFHLLLPSLLRLSSIVCFPRLQPHHQALLVMQPPHSPVPDCVTPTVFFSSSAEPDSGSSVKAFPSPTSIHP